MASAGSSADKSCAGSSASLGKPSASSSSAKSAAGKMRAILSMPPQWLDMYGNFITKNQGQVSQIESALRSLTYIIPGRFRDAEIASETIHSGVQLLSMYHDAILQRAASSTASSSTTSSPSSSQTLPPRQSAPPPHRTMHARYTTFWSQKSPLYRRVALALQVVQYTQLLIEMAAKRRGDERLRWRVVVLVEAFKALCKLILLRLTRARALLTPALPERVPVPETDEDEAISLEENNGEFRIPDELRDDTNDADSAYGSGSSSNGKLLQNGTGHVNGNGKAIHTKDWHMPRTNSTMPALPSKSDISSYLMARVLTADDIKPAPRLLQPLTGASYAAEVLHIIAPLVYAMALAHFSLRQKDQSTSRSSYKKPSTLTTWTPWLLGLALSLAARRLRDRGLRTSALEREEWTRRGWAMGWWAMRGAAYEGITKGVVERVRKRMPNFIGGIIEDYEYLWENYYFSTAD